jgi:hypothetical protein
VRHFLPQKDETRNSSCRAEHRILRGGEEADLTAAAIQLNPAAKPWIASRSSPRLGAKPRNDIRFQISAMG